jgi:nucleoid DNA-binding protein
MDIAKYIGLFLLKNHFCYVHGIGNLEVVKRPAMYDGQALQAPFYEVVVTPGGSIDDNLANFIATNEQISISKAANALREYSGQARKIMAEGGEVSIPNIGKLIEQNNKIQFVTDANFKFTPAGIPTIKNSKQLDEYNAKASHKPAYPTPTKADAVNWSMVILVIVLLLVVGGGIYGIYYYTRQSRNIVAPQPILTRDTVVPVTPPPPDTTSQLQRDSMSAAAAMPVDSLQINSYKMVIGDYPSREKAEKRVKNLKLNGNQVELSALDSLNFLVTTTVSCKAADTTHVIDSLQRLFGYKHVMTIK